MRARLIWLRDPAAYPDRPAAVIPVETSRSWAFLTDRFAYKLKKPIRYPLVDLSTLGARKANAEAEVRLNRGPAPGIYLGIVVLSEGPLGQFVLGGHGQAVDWLVKMRRLPDRLMLDSLLIRQALPPVRLHALAEQLACFYVGSQRLSLSGPTYRQRLREELQINHAILTDAESRLPLERVKLLRAKLLSFLDENAGLLDARGRRVSSRRARGSTPGAHLSARASGSVPGHATGPTCPWCRAGSGIWTSTTKSTSVPRPSPS